MNVHAVSLKFLVFPMKGFSSLSLNLNKMCWKMFVSLGDQDKQSYNLLIYVHLCALGRKTSEHDPFIFHENTVPAKMSKCGLILSGFFGKDSQRGLQRFQKVAVRRVTHLSAVYLFNPKINIGHLSEMVNNNLCLIVRTVNITDIWAVVLW